MKFTSNDYSPKQRTGFKLIFWLLIFEAIIFIATTTLFFISSDIYRNVILALLCLMFVVALILFILTFNYDLPQAIKTWEQKHRQ